MNEHRYSVAHASLAGPLMIALLLALGALPDSAQAQRNAGRNGGVFLEIGNGARQAALGSAATAFDRSAGQIFWNPAGTALGSDQKASVTLSYNSWIADLQYTSAAVGYNLGAGGTITAGVQAFGVSDIEANRQNGYEDPLLQDLVTDHNTSATFDYLDLAISGTYARNFLDEQLSLGATAKYVRESIDGVSASAVAFDFGSVYRVGVAGWKIAARINNLGSSLSYYNQENPLPLTFSIGTCFYPINNERTRLMIALDGVKPQDSQELLYGGAELSFFDLLFLRGGYKFNYSNASDGGTSEREPIETSVEKFSLGGGLQYELSGIPIAVDYAFTRMDLLDDAHRLTLSLNL